MNLDFIQIDLSSKRYQPSVCVCALVCVCINQLFAHFTKKKIPRIWLSCNPGKCHHQICRQDLYLVLPITESQSATLDTANSAIIGRIVLILAAATK